MGNFTRSFYSRPELWHRIEEIASAEGVSVSAVINRSLHEYLQRDFTRSSWDTMPDDEWYDERRFYTYSQDKKGHSVTAKFAIPKNVAGGIRRLVDSGSIPELRSVADYYRNAIFHWTRKVSQWVDDGELLNEVNLHYLQMEDDTIMQTEKDFESLIVGMKQVMDTFLASEDWTYMETYLEHRQNVSSVVQEKFRAEYLDVLGQYQEKLEAARDLADRARVRSLTS